MLLAHRSSGLTGSSFTVTDEAGGAVGAVIWPKVAQASNARLRLHEPGSTAGQVTIDCFGQRYGVAFEYLRRGFTNDTRFTLSARDGPPSAPPLAIADYLVPPGLGRGAMHLVVPFTGRLLRTSRWPRQRLTVERDGRALGTIEEPSWLSLVRSMRIDLPSTVPAPIQLFLFFLAEHLVQTQA